jgi:CDP-glucose 4,6-dehydratase
MESLVTARGFWSGKKVLVTGHTGFKGSWLVLWLQALGARVAGYALGPPSEPSLWGQLNLASEIRTDTADIRDLERLMRMFQEFRPQIVFHLAAQSLVRPSYEDPVATYSTNVMGTVNVLEAVRRSGDVRVVVNVTSDKCYENREWDRGYREDDAMGGYDPYSSSKACAELVTTAYRNSFFNPDKYQEHGVALASARAGNVIGGGDWARDRLVPDVMRAALRGEPARIRNPKAVRPWQHVLDPLHGYLLLAEHLWNRGPEFAGGWNFGPEEEDAAPVYAVVDQLVSRWGNSARWIADSGEHPHEARHLRLDCTKARSRLGWFPRLPLADALSWTVEWYRGYGCNADLKAICLEQIARFEKLATK